MRVAITPLKGPWVSRTEYGLKAREEAFDHLIDSIRVAELHVGLRPRGFRFCPSGTDALAASAQSRPGSGSWMSLVRGHDVPWELGQ